VDLLTKLFLSFKNYFRNIIIIFNIKYILLRPENTGAEGTSFKRGPGPSAILEGGMRPSSTGVPTTLYTCYMPCKSGIQSLRLYSQSNLPLKGSRLPTGRVHSIFKAGDGGTTNATTLETPSLKKNTLGRNKSQAGVINRLIYPQCYSKLAGTLTGQLHASTLPRQSKCISYTGARLLVGTKYVYTTFSFQVNASVSRSARMRRKTRTMWV
jgi:hypothetical protein